MLDVAGDAVVTERLLLRRFQAEDRTSHGRLFATPEQTAFLGGGPVPPDQVNLRASLLIDHYRNHWQQFGFGPWAVVDRANGELIGQCGLRHAPESDEIELLYAIDRPAWGRGFATEAARAALAYGFGTMGLARVVGFVHPDNLASQRVLEKVGMRREDWVMLYDSRIDRYAVSRHEFFALEF